MYDIVKNDNGLYENQRLNGLLSMKLEIIKIKFRPFYKEIINKLLIHFND